MMTTRYRKSYSFLIFSETKCGKSKALATTMHIHCKITIDPFCPILKKFPAVFTKKYKNGNAYPLILSGKFKKLNCPSDANESASSIYNGHQMHNLH